MEDINCANKIEIDFTADEVNVRIQFVKINGEPIIGIDTSENETVSISGTKKNIDMLIKQLCVIRAAVYDHGVLS